jgi:hypothetical protein
MAIGSFGAAVWFSQEYLRSLSCEFTSSSDLSSFFSSSLLLRYFVPAFLPSLAATGTRDRVG